VDLKDDFEFRFDQPLTEKPQAENGGDIEPPESGGHLAFSCPKCSAEIEFDFSGEGQDSYNVTCGNCGAAVALIRESCATRARSQQSGINCANCGSALDHKPHCPACGTLFPDYYVAVSAEEAGRRAKAKRRAELRQTLSRFNPSFYFDFFRPLTGRAEHIPEARPVPERRAAPKAVVSPRGLRLVITLLVITLLTGGASYAFHRHQRQQEFIDNYFRAVNGVKVGNDYAQQVCLQMAASWKSATDSGTRYTPRPNEKDEARLNKTRQNVDKLLQYMGSPPAKFAQAHQKLVQLKNAYQKTQDLATNPPESLQSLTTSADQAASGFKAAAQDLKSNLPEAFKDKLDDAKLKYRGLKEL